MKGSDWIVGKKFFMEGAVRHWNRLSGQVVDSSPLEVFKRCIEEILRDVA